MECFETAKFMAKVLDGKLAKDVKIVKVCDFTVVTDYYVIATANSGSHVKALRDELEFRMTEKGVEPNKKEVEAENWMVLDYSDVIVHIFDEETRAYYKLEKLWEDAPILEFQ